MAAYEARIVLALVREQSKTALVHVGAWSFLANAALYAFSVAVLCVYVQSRLVFEERTRSLSLVRKGALNG